MGEPQVIFTDREGDRVEIITRDLSEFGNPIPDPTISITRNNGKYDIKHTVVMDDKELDTFLRTLCDKFGYIAFKNDSEQKMMEQVVATVVSGIHDAIPEQDDADMARKLLGWIEAEAERDI